MSNGVPPATAQAAAGAAAAPVGAAATTSPFVVGLLGALPPLGSHFHHKDRMSWLQAAEAMFDLMYHQPEQDITVTTAPLPPPPPPAADGSGDGADAGDGSDSAPTAAPATS